MFRSGKGGYSRVALSEEAAEAEEDVQSFLRNSKRKSAPAEEQELEELEELNRPKGAQQRLMLGGGREEEEGGEEEGDITVKTLNLDFSQDHTATMRTMMAWTRTSLSMISIGLTLMKLFDKEDEILGFVFIILGVIYSIVSSLRFYRTFHHLESGRFRTNNLVIFVTSLTALLGNIVLVLVLVIKSPFE